MNINLLPLDPLLHITKYLDSYEVQNLSSACKSLRDELFTEYFFDCLPTQLGLPFIGTYKVVNKATVKKPLEELQSELCTALSRILASWQKVFPETKMRQFEQEPEKNGRLLTFQIAYKEITEKWAEASCTSIGAPEFFSTKTANFSPEFILLLEALSHKALSSIPKEQIESAVFSLTKSAPGQVIQDPVTKLCVFHIWLFSLISANTTMDTVTHALDSMPPSLKSHAIKYSLAKHLTEKNITLESSKNTDYYYKELLPYYLNDTATDWPKGAKETVCLVVKSLNSLQGKCIAGNGIIAQGLNYLGFILSLNALCSTAASLLEAHIPAAINPVPAGTESLASAVTIDAYIAELPEVETSLLSNLVPIEEEPSQID